MTEMNSTKSIVSESARLQVVLNHLNITVIYIYIYIIPIHVSVRVCWNTNNITTSNTPGFPDDTQHTTSALVIHLNSIYQSLSL